MNKPTPRPDPDKTLVEILVYHPATCSYVPCWVSLREAWITHQPGLVPPPGRNAQ